jgi:hypothetical protein
MEELGGREAAMGFFLGHEMFKIDCGDSCTTLNILEIIEMCISNG